MQDEASSLAFDCAASVGSVAPLLPLEEPAVPLLLPLLPAPPPLPLLPVDALAASLSVDALDPAPLSSPDEPEPLEALLQATSPTVDDAPMTTMTWKSFSTFMKRTLRPMSELGPDRRCPGWN